MNKKFLIMLAILLLAALSIWIIYDKGTEMEESLISIDNSNSGQAGGNDQENLIMPPENIQEKVSLYLRNNIASLSSEKPVLGGSWYVTRVEFLQGNKGRVYYEDGHIAREASFSYVIDENSVAIFNFYITPEEIIELSDNISLENSNNTGLADSSDDSMQSEDTDSVFNQEEEPVFCTMDAMMCPDGSYVGRIAPNCDFAPCSGNN